MIQLQDRLKYARAPVVVRANAAFLDDLDGSYGGKFTRAWVHQFTTTTGSNVTALYFKESPQKTEFKAR